MKLWIILADHDGVDFYIVRAESPEKAWEIAGQGYVLTGKIGALSPVGDEKVLWNYSFSDPKAKWENLETTETEFKQIVHKGDA